MCSCAPEPKLRSKPAKPTTPTSTAAGTSESPSQPCGGRRRSDRHQRFLNREWVPKAKLDACGLKPIPRREPAPTKFGQHKALTAVRRADPDGVGALTVSALRGALNRLADAWKDVGKTRPNGTRVRPPCFKARNCDHVIDYADPSAIHVRGRYIACRDFGAVRFRNHRALPEGTPIAIRIVRDDTAGDARDNRGGRWTAHLTWRVPTKARRPRGRCTGIDLGTTDYAVTCDGVALKAHRAGRRDEPATRRRQRAVARSVKGSHRRRKRRVRHRKALARVSSKRQDEARRAAARIVQRNDGIAVERPSDLRGLYRMRLAKSLHDAGWEIFRNALAWACTKAGAPLTEVPAAGTSRDCPWCLRKGVHNNSLSARIHVCQHCGRGGRRDVVSAFEILRRSCAELDPWRLQRGHRGRRRAGNTRPSTSDGRGGLPPHKAGARTGREGAGRGRPVALTTGASWPPSRRKHPPSTSDGRACAS